MPVTLIKRECPNHPGCYTLSGPCERCIDEQFHQEIDAIFKRMGERIREACRRQR